MVATKNPKTKVKTLVAVLCMSLSCLTSALNFSWVNTEQWIEIGAPRVLVVFDPVGLGQVAGITKKKTQKMVKYRVKNTATGMRTLP